MREYLSFVTIIIITLASTRIPRDGNLPSRDSPLNTYSSKFLEEKDFSNPQIVKLAYLEAKFVKEFTHYNPCLGFIRELFVSKQ